MDAEAIVWLIFIAIWFISGVVRQIKQVSSQRPGQEGQPQPTGQSSREMRGEPDRRPADRPKPALPDDDPMVQLLRKLGGEVEVRPQEAPRETRQQPARSPMPAPPPAPPAPPVQVSATIDRSRPAKVARRPKITELAAIPKMKQPHVVPTVSSGGGPATALARALRRDLRQPDSVRKAIMLQEILGKPPGLQGLRGR